MSLAESLDPKGFLVADTWRQAIIECWGKSFAFMCANFTNC